VPGPQQLLAHLTKFFWVHGGINDAAESFDLELLPGAELNRYVHLPAPVYCGQVIGRLVAGRIGGYPEGVVSLCHLVTTLAEARISREA